MNKKLLEKIRTKFVEKLQGKTGYGRVELLAIYDSCVNEAILELLDEGY